MERIKGVIYGAALADAVGAYTELRTRKSLQHISDHTFTFPLPGVIPEKRDPDRLWTDDTNQMICVIDMLYQNRGKVDILLFAKILRDWVKHGFSEIGQTKGDGVGGTTHAIVMNPGFLSDPVSVSRSHFTSGKSPNGALVRAAIMGCRNGSKKMVMKDTLLLCKTTHCEYRCATACCIITSMVFDLVNGVATSEVLGTAAKYNSRQSSHYKEIARHCNAMSLEELELDDTTMGYSLKCLGVAIWAFRNAVAGRNYKEIITEIALQGGDSDTNGMVAGAIIGAMRGPLAVPAEWMDNLRCVEFLDKKVGEMENANRMLIAKVLAESLERAESKLVEID